MRSSTPALDLRKRTQQVAEYQHDPALTGRPIGLMMAGVFLAIVSAGLCGVLAYQIWYAREISASSGLYGVSLLFVFYVAGCYVFSLAYELYDVEKAIALTFILAVLGVIALAFMIGALIALAFVKTGAGIAISEQQGGRALGALASLGGEQEEEDVRPAEIPGFSMITCRTCERAFFPTPPSAICPWCDTAYLSA